MAESTHAVLLSSSNGGFAEAHRLAGAFIASFGSVETRKAYRQDLASWFLYCNMFDVEPIHGVRRTHVEVWLRQLEGFGYANATRNRRVSTLSSFFGWLEDEEIVSGNPCARVRRPRRHRTPQPWLNRNEVTDWLAAAEDEGGYSYALACLLALNGLRVSEACSANVTDLGGERYQPTLFILGKGDKPAEVYLNPRTTAAIEDCLAGRTSGPLLLNKAGNRMTRANASAVVKRLAVAAGITKRVTPHALRRSYITVGLEQGVPLVAMQRAARHASPDTTVGYDQSERSAHKDPTFVLMGATAR